MDRKSLILTRTRAATRAPHKIWEKNSQQCTGRDGNHSFYKAHFNVKIIYRYTYEGGVLRRHSKAIRCSS